MSLPRHDRLFPVANQILFVTSVLFVPIQQSSIAHLIEREHVDRDQALVRRASRPVTQRQVEQAQCFAVHATAPSRCSRRIIDITQSGHAAGLDRKYKRWRLLRLSSISDDVIPTPVLEREVAQKVVNGNIFRLRHDCFGHAHVMAGVQQEIMWFLGPLTGKCVSSLVTTNIVSIAASHAT